MRSLDASQQRRARKPASPGLQADRSIQRPGISEIASRARIPGWLLRAAPRLKSSEESVLLAIMQKIAARAGSGGGAAPNSSMPLYSTSGEISPPVITSNAAWSCESLDACSSDDEISVS